MPNKEKQNAFARAIETRDELRVAIDQIPDKDYFASVRNAAREFLDLYETLLFQSEPLCPTYNPETEEGRKYLEAAQSLGVDPILLGMIIKNEWNNRSVENVFPFLLHQALADSGRLTGTFGVGQIYTETAIDVIQRNPQEFSEDQYPQLYIDGELDSGRVEWELFVNEPFNMRVAAGVIAMSENILLSSLTEAGIEVSDVPVEGRLSITKEEYDKLLAYMYRSGGGGIEELSINHPNGQDALNALLITINEVDAEHVTNVFSNKEAIEDVLGVQWVACEG